MLSSYSHKYSYHRTLSSKCYACEWFQFQLAPTCGHGAMIVRYREDLTGCGVCRLGNLELKRSTVYFLAEIIDGLLTDFFGYHFWKALWFPFRANRGTYYFNFVPRPQDVKALVIYIVWINGSFSSNIYTARAFDQAER